MPNDEGYSRMIALLGQYGLTGLDAWLRRLLVDGASEATIALELETTPQFEARFSARKAALEHNRVNPNSPVHVPSPAEILEYEQQVRGIMRRANVPAGFYDDQREIQQLMIDGKSVLEVQANVEEGFLRVSQAPQEVRDAYADFFGPQGDAALAAYFLDRDLSMPILERQVRTAEIAGTGRRFGVALTEDRADRLAEVGFDAGNSAAAFESVNAARALYGRTVDEQAEEDLTAEGAGVDFAFGLDSGVAARRIVSRQERREAAFRGAGGAAESREGLAGLGTADS